MGIRQELFKPFGRTLERVPSSDVVDKEGTDGSSVVGPCDAPERLLPSCVPNLQLHCIAFVQIDRSRAELNANGQLVVVLEALVGELEE